MISEPTEYEIAERALLRIGCVNPPAHVAGTHYPLDAPLDSYFILLLKDGYRELTRREIDALVDTCLVDVRGIVGSTEPNYWLTDLGRLLLAKCPLP